MASFIHRCPKTGLSVQGWFADAGPANEAETYEAVMCTACSQVHLVNRSTGRTLGDDDDPKSHRQLRQRQLPA